MKKGWRFIPEFCRYKKLISCAAAVLSF
jgi:hypothetical protein